MWYAYVIDTASKNAVDIIFSQNSAAPALPAGYVYYRLVGAFKTNAVSLPIEGAYYGDYFYFKNTNVVDYTATIPIGFANSIYPTLSVPANATGIIQIRYSPNDTGAGWSESTPIILSVGPTTMNYLSSDQNDYSFWVTCPSGGSATCSPGYITDTRIIGVDGNRQIAIYCNNTSRNVTLNVSIRTLGWIFQRNTFMP
jgi:hypothetical protein